MTVSLPPEPDCIVRLRHVLTRYDESGYQGDTPSDPQYGNAVVEAARDVLHTLDTERQRMLAAMSTQIVRQFDLVGTAARQYDQMAGTGVEQQLTKLRERLGLAAVADPDHPSALHPNWVPPEGVEPDHIAP